MECPICSRPVDVLDHPDGARDLVCSCGWSEHRPRRLKDRISIAVMADGIVDVFSSRPARVEVYDFSSVEGPFEYEKEEGRSKPLSEEPDWKEIEDG